MDTGPTGMTDEEILKQFMETAIEMTDSVSEEVVERAKKSWANAWKDAIEWHKKHPNEGNDTIVQDENQDRAT